MVASAKRPTEAWHTAGLFERGFGQVIIARFKGSGEAEVGVFLVDTFCLGVKDAYFTRLWPDEYEKRVLNRLEEQGGREAIEPECARKLVEEAVAYARSLGLEPHPDFKLGARVFGGIEARSCPRTFEFGKDGKPLYVQTPNDSEAFAQNVMGTLTRRLGQDGFHFMLFLGEAPRSVKATPDAKLEPEAPDAQAGTEPSASRPPDA